MFSSTLSWAAAGVAYNTASDREFTAFPQALRSYYNTSSHLLQAQVKKHPKTYLICSFSSILLTAT